VLVVEDPRDEVARAAGAAGVDVARWDRRARPGRTAEPWPAGGPWHLAAIRLARAKDELEMAVHAVTARLVPGGALWIYGANDEGIRSVAERVEPLLGRVGTLRVGGHARLIGAARPTELAGLRATLADWRQVHELGLPWGRRPWVSYPGVFAAGRVDPGTALLLEHLPAVPCGGRVLDYGAGSGLLAAGVRAAASDVDLTLLEIDAVAAKAAEANVPEARVVVGDGWVALGAGDPFDAVVANPPYHRGKAESLEAVAELVRGAAEGLGPEGVLRMVVQRRLPAAELLAHWAGPVSIVADRGAYRVWEARRERS
jgi:16S rRNA (guanine1207-N2)-methyltransferase